MRSILEFLDMMSPEQKQETANIAKASWNDSTPEQKHELYTKIKDKYNTSTPDEKKELVGSIRDSWKNSSDEDKNQVKNFFKKDNEDTPQPFFVDNMKDRVEKRYNFIKNNHEEIPKVVKDTWDNMEQKEKDEVVSKTTHSVGEKIAGALSSVGRGLIGGVPLSNVAHSLTNWQMREGRKNWDRMKNEPI